MAPQSAALVRLKLLVLSLAAFMLVISVSGLVLLDVYLLSVVTANRLASVNRTRSYLQPSITACIMLRNLYLIRETNSSQLAASYRASISHTAHNMLAINTLNFKDPPSPNVLNYILSNSLEMRIPVPGHSQGSVQTQQTDFLDFVGQFVSSLMSAASVSLSDLQAPNYDVLSVNKRAVVFL